MNYFTSEKEKEQKILEFKNKLLEKIQEPVFESKIKLLLSDINLHKAKLTANGFIYKTTEKNPRIITISIAENDVYYSEEISNYLVTGMYHIDQSGRSYTKYTTTETTIYNSIFMGKKNPLYNMYNISKETKFHAFDEQHKEIWNLTEDKKDNYYQNKITKEKILSKPNCFENYVEKEYHFREGEDIILMIRKINYYHPEDENNNIKNEDNYLIARNPNPKAKQLYRAGYYTWVPKEMFVKYKLGESSLGELWKSRGKSRILTTTTYF